MGVGQEEEKEALSKECRPHWRPQEQSSVGTVWADSLLFLPQNAMRAQPAGVAFPWVLWSEVLPLPQLCTGPSLKTSVFRFPLTSC